MQELILIRGLPGSGKSYLADWLKTVLNYDPDWWDGSEHMWFHRETDQFFCSDKYVNDYKFDASKLKEAHQWCQNEVRGILNSGCSVIVSNTFTRIWEMQPYIDMAKEFGAKLTVITCEGQYGSVHNVPQEKIQEMKLRWEPYV